MQIGLTGPRRWLRGLLTWLYLQHHPRSKQVGLNPKLNCLHFILTMWHCYELSWLCSVESRTDVVNIGSRRE